MRLTKSERREKRKKPKMAVHGRNVKRLVKTIMDSAGNRVIAGFYLENDLKKKKR